MKPCHKLTSARIIYPRISNLLLLIALSATVFSSSAQPTSNMQLIEERIAQYAQSYPEIEFTLLDQKEDYDQLLPLTQSLGQDVSNLDYQHPEELRKTLIDAQEYRIGFLLNNGMGSATLFNTPNAAVTEKPYTCLITPSQQLFDQDPLAATRFMYDLDETTVASIPVSRRIDNMDFLIYTLDHEVFHCIDAYTNGPLYVQTFDPIKSWYDRASAELRSDIFSALAHLSRQPDAKKFITNIANARTLNLLSWDVEHYTANALNKIADTSELYTPGNIKILIQKTMQLSEKMTPTYAEHAQFLAAAWVVVQKFGLDKEEIPSDYAIIADWHPEPEQVRTLHKEISHAILAIHTKQK